VTNKIIRSVVSADRSRCGGRGNPCPLLNRISQFVTRKVSYNPVSSWVHNSLHFSLASSGSAQFNEGPHAVPVVKEIMRKAAFVLASSFLFLSPSVFPHKIPLLIFRRRLSCRPRHRCATCREWGPLVATGPVTALENKDLDAALVAFHDAPANAGEADDFPTMPSRCLLL
jgi:hypothetical protein